MQLNNGTLNIPRPSSGSSGGTSSPTMPTATPANTPATKKKSSQGATYKPQQTSLLQTILNGIAFRPNVDSYAIFKATQGFGTPKYVYDPAVNNALIPRAQPVSSNGGFIPPLLPYLPPNPFLELNGIDDGTGNGNYYYIPYYNGGGGGGGSSYSVPRWMLNDIYWRL